MRALPAFTSNYVGESFGFRDKIVIPPAIDTELFSPGKNSVKREDEKFKYKLGYFGRLRESRFPYRTVLRGIKKFEEKTAKRILLKIKYPSSGGEKKISEELLRFAEKIGMQGRVLASSEVMNEDEKVKFLQESDLTLFPSWNLKGTLDPPFTILESMASGNPVITSSLGSIPSFIIDGENGLLLKNLTPNEISRSLSEALLEKEPKKIGARARETIIRRFSINCVSKKIESIYSSLHP